MNSNTSTAAQNSANATTGDDGVSDVPVFSLDDDDLLEASMATVQAYSDQDH